jgi:hypothetical protein
MDGVLRGLTLDSVQSPLRSWYAVHRLRCQCQINQGLKELRILKEYPWLIGGQEAVTAPSQWLG